MYSRLVLNSFFALTTLASSLTFAQDASNQGREFHWQGKLPAENVLSIKNVNGEVEASLASGDQIEVIAEKSGPHADEVKIQMVQRNDGIVFCAVLPGWYNDHCESWNSHNNHSEGTKVHFTVKVPENISFSGENVNGSVNAENMGRFVRASSVNGKVRVSTKSWAEVSSVNGSIEARMGRSDWPGTLKAETVNGSIRLELPADTNTNVRFESVNGHLESDFPLQVHGSMSGHSLTGQIGSGGRDLKVETVNGSVEIRRGSM